MTRLFILGWLLVSPLFLIGAEEASFPKKGMVLISERPEIVNEFQVRGTELKTLFRGMICRWTGAAEPREAWKALGIRPGDVVGVKINTVGGSVIAVKRALVEEVAATLLEAGAREVIVWDKYQVEMREAGYLPSLAQGYRLEAVIPGEGFDEGQFYLNEYLGRLIWGDHLFKRVMEKKDLRKLAEESAQSKSGESTTEGLGGVEDQTSNKSFFAKLLTQKCTKIVNIASFMDHETVGIWGTLSSLALGSVDNTRRFTQGVNAGDPAIAEILNRDLFRKKTVLHILDGSIGQFAGGPIFAPHFAKPFGLLIMGNDPVAIDRWVMDRIQKSRSRFDVVPVGEEGRHLQSCAEAGLGEGEFKRIKVTRYP